MLFITSLLGLALKIASDLILVFVDPRISLD
jgi:ABC-type microcin C transport system permease subunit YejB